MRAWRIVAPLVSGSTYRRGVHLLLGGVLLLPYVLLGVAFGQLLRSDTPRVLSLLLLALAAVIAGAPAFLSASRTLETVAARALLEVDLPDPVGDPCSSVTSFSPISTPTARCGPARGWRRSR